MFLFIHVYIKEGILWVSVVFDDVLIVYEVAFCVLFRYRNGINNYRLSGAESLVIRHCLPENSW